MEYLRAQAAPSTSSRDQPAEEFPELDCVRRRLPAKTIAAAERRACEVGVTADRVLITSGLLTEDVYVRLLAHDLGLTFEPLETPPDGDCLVSEERLIDASAAGLLPLVRNEGNGDRRRSARKCDATTLHNRKQFGRVASTPAADQQRTTGARHSPF